VAFRQQTQKGAEIGKSAERQRASHQPACAEVQGLDGVGSQMLVEPGAPNDIERIARLKQTSKTRRTPPANQAEMAAVRSGQRFTDRRRLPMLLDAEDDAFVTPFHRAAGRAARPRAAAQADHGPRNRARPWPRRDAAREGRTDPTRPPW